MRALPAVRPSRALSLVAVVGLGVLLSAGCGLKGKQILAPAKPERLIASTAQSYADSFPAPGKFSTIDLPATWSADGREVAFWRFVRSRYGSPGLYTLSLDGSGLPKFRLPFEFFSREVTFSPDSRKLAGLAGGNLYILDLMTGGIAWPAHGSSHISSIDWSPDGNRLLLARTYDDSPAESIGVHVYDLRTQRETPLLNRLIVAEEVRWSPTGDRVAMVESAVGNYFVTVYSLLDTTRVQISVGTGYAGYDDLQWLRPSPLKQTGLLSFEKFVNPGGGCYVVSPDGTGLRKLPFRYLYLDRFSPDAHSMLKFGFQGSDSLGVVYLLKLDANFRIVQSRQLTSWPGGREMGGPHDRQAY